MHLTAGQIVYRQQDGGPLEALGQDDILLPDKGYDTDALWEYAAEPEA